MDTVIRINDGSKIVSYSWAGLKMYETAYPTGVTQLTMIAHASSAKGFFAWLSEDGHLLTMEIVTGASTWVTIKNPLFLARYRYIKGEW